MRFCKLLSAKVLLKLEFDTEDQVSFSEGIKHLCMYVGSGCGYVDGEEKDARKSNTLGNEASKPSTGAQGF